MFRLDAQGQLRPLGHMKRVHRHHAVIAATTGFENFALELGAARLGYAGRTMTGRKILATWTGRVKRGSPTRKLARYRSARRLTGCLPPTGRKMTADEAMQFALDKYETALRRLAQTP